VLNGKLKASILIPNNFSRDIKEGYGSEITLYVDNSKTQTAIMASESIKALTQNINEKIGTEFIKNAWNKLNELNNKLKFVVTEASVAKDQTIILQAKIIELQTNLSKIDTKKIEEEIAIINQTVLSITNNTYNINSEINNETELLKDIYNSTCPGQIGPEKCLALNKTIDNLYLINDKLINNTQSINTKSINIKPINETKNAIINQLQELNSTFFNYTNNLIGIIDELNKTTQALDTYTSRDPKNIVRAVTLNEEKVFGEKTYFEFLSHGLILVLLLFTIILVSSSNIVYERKSGTLARTLLSPTSIPMFLFSKLIFFLMISIIELIVMLITIRLFGIAIPINKPILIILLISSANFIFIGLILGAISNSENTALLSSLVIALPMFFLSNLFFPFEIMPKFMKIIGSNLPLTLSIDSLDKIITYSTALDINSIIKLTIITIAIAILTYLAIKKKPISE